MFVTYSLFQRGGKKCDRPIHLPGRVFLLTHSRGNGKGLCDRLRRALTTKIAVGLSTGCCGCGSCYPIRWLR
ncbi:MULTISPECIES: hypothetical protein [unclassified Microcoleus]|uniref:hypothetical protein n=1 Tax=unclassified Microcoleus TaxID=2642155 RepID=UPI0026008C87|nr:MULTISPECIES: hypothetical protein [unclassified Microcoleus]